MEAQEITIQDRLREDCQEFIKWADTLSDEQFAVQLDGKWSVVEVMQHLFLSARPVARLLAGSRDALKQWGRSETLPKGYDEIASTYKTILGTGVKAPAGMSPRPEDIQIGRGDMVKRFEGIYEDLIRAVEYWPTHELDDYCIPHPVLGKLSVREMLYFTSIHTQHHLELLK
ncbi:DinB family protein [Spirosoma fluviale]|uniref:DinB superfamily protein n=1 Tax=Spirosoma fluviale TaxID=1597977 RepID=A0A286GQ76_9BACT|nr:DinB family protein [Spirosoma fluviale]SOD97346.1 DinB superfamily protein [Spirosoma fluviale]